MMNKKGNSISKNKRSTQWYKFNNSEWQAIIPGFIISSWGLFFLIASTLGWHFFAPGENIIALLLFALGLLIILQAIRHELTSAYPRIIATLLAVIVTLVTIFWLGGTSDNSCFGLMNEQISCIDNNRFIITILFRNPFSLAIIAILTIIGILNVLTSSKKPTS